MAKSNAKFGNALSKLPFAGKSKIAAIAVPFAIAGAALAISLLYSDLNDNTWKTNFVLLTCLGLLLVYLALPFILNSLRGGGESPQTATSVFSEPRNAIPAVIAIVLFTMAFPFLFSSYQSKIMVMAMTYVVLGLGLNIVVGLAGLLDLGYVAFYAVGAYTYGLLHLYFGVGFWVAFPLGGVAAAIFGILLGYPVLRLRGDYLAIVTLGFGEIIRLVLENWGSFTQGPSGIKNIPPPVEIPRGSELAETLSAFNINKMTIIYFIMLALVVVTIFFVNRLKVSRLGRAWQALREDEIACQAMGIDKTKTKLTAFALGATWAGFAGVLFASRETFINPKSFEFIESALILSIVVVGGMGSIVGVILGAIIIMLMPEYLRAFSEYRMLLFGAIMVIIMVFRPQGIISHIRSSYIYKAKEEPKDA
ncbi:MAG: high-affinity branched-chain amino acid ABC transporter permease LivM [Desulfovibrio sp.]|nr:MAG: high-affinity branched-chain amino acid ABC transporter permease LivM [Desulfovibrio sp.]